MALLFVDGFDHYATADITKKWTTTNGSVAINSTAGRRGGGAFRSTTFGSYLSKTITNGSSFVIGFSFKISAFISLGSPQALVSLFDSALNSQCDVRINLDGTLSVTRNGTALTSGTSVSAVSTNTEYYLEWKVTISDSISANTCKVRINGVDWINVATGQDTKSSGNTGATSVRIGQVLGAPNGTTLDMDDFYLCDSSGSTNNDFLGDCRIDTLLPTADGTYSAFTPSTGTSHYQLVDESTPNTTDYNESSTATNKDSYQMQDLSAITGTIYGVQVLGAVLKDDAGARSIKVGVRSSSTDSVSAAQAVSTSQLYYSNIHETNPATGVAWTESGVNAAEALFEIA